MKTLFSLLLAAVLALPAWADDATSGNQQTLAVSAMLQYDSEYILYGYRQDGPLLHATLYLAYPLTDAATLWGGSWFGIIPDGTYRELDGFIGMDYSIWGPLVVGAAGSAFHYIDVPFSEKSMAYELFTHISYYGDRSLVALRDYIDTESHGHLIRLVANYTQPVTKRVSLKGNAEFGYALRYFVSGNHPNDVLLKLEAPIAISESCRISPYIARTFALDAIKDYEKDDTFGGVSISWTL